MTRLIVQSLNSTFPQLPVIPSIGNHDCHTVNLYPFGEEDNYVDNNIYPLYRQYIGSDNIEHAKEFGFFALSHPRHNLRFISINFNINDIMNTFHMSQHAYVTKFLYKLAKELYACESEGMRVIVLVHGPIAYLDTFEKIDKALLVLFKRFDSTIIGIFSGHTHKD